MMFEPARAYGKAQLTAIHISTSVLFCLLQLPAAGHVENPAALKNILNM